MRNTFATLSGMRCGTTKEERREYMRWWRNINRDDYNKKRLEWAHTHAERRTKQSRSSHLMSKFGISLDEYDNLLLKQDYKCAICGKSLVKLSDVVGRVRTNLCVDHNHATGKVRGLLCSSCNFVIGHSFENTEILSKTISYLQNN